MTSLILALTALVAAPGEWPEPRQNPHLTAIQPLPGRMDEAPAVIAQYELPKTRLNITPVSTHEGQRGTAMVHGALRCYQPDGTLAWESHPAGLNFATLTAVADFDGDGRTELLYQAGRPAQPYGAAVLVDAVDGRVLWRYDVDPMSYVWYLYAGHYLPDTDSQQIVVIMHGYPPDTQNGYIALFTFPEAGAAPVQQWRYDFDLYTCMPSFLQSDLDGDAVKELMVVTHSRMWCFDAVTGAVKQFFQWDVSPANVRSYGLTRFVDLNGDGREDFLCIADFSQHHEVLLNRDGELKPAWHYGWPESVTTGKVATAYPEPPYADLDGDGDLEVVVSVFNSEEDGAWLTRVYDAVTGTMQFRAPGVVAVAVADADGDGDAEILGNLTDDPTRTELNGAVLLSASEDALNELWRDPAQTAIPSTENTLRVQDGAGTLQALAWRDGIALAPWTAPPVPDLPSFAAPPADVAVQMPSLLSANLDSEGANKLLLCEPDGVQILTLTDGAFTPGKRYISSATPCLADTDGDGVRELVTCTVGPDIVPAAECRSLKGGETLRWRTELPPPGRPGLPQPRAAYLRGGRFTGRAGDDIYFWAGTPVVRSVVLDGATGEMRWDNGECEGIERYWGPSVNQASVHDFDGNGREDLVFTNPDYYCVADGVTGDSLLGPLFPPKIFSQPSQGLYTLPAILDGDPPLVCLVGGHYFQGCMTLQAEPRWYTLPPIGEARCAEEAFLHLPDGQWLMGFGRQNGDFACINVADGTERWTLPVGASATNAIACDADNDGAAEFLFGTSHGDLVAVGDAGGQPRVLWRKAFDAAVGAPIAADVNADGSSEVIVCTADGVLWVLGSE